MTSLSTRARRVATLGLAATLFPAMTVLGPGNPATAEVQVLHDVSRSVADRAKCGSGSTPETGMQGDVPAADCGNGRSTQGYTCNITRVGSYAGHGGGVVSAAFDTCVYIGSFIPGRFDGPAGRRSGAGSR